MPSPNRSEADARVVILRLKRARNPDAVCMSVLDRFIEQMHEANVNVLLCGVRPDLDEGDRLQRLDPPLGTGSRVCVRRNGQFWTSTLEAVRFAYELIGDDVCETCPRHAESLNKKDGWHYLI